MPQIVRFIASTPAGGYVRRYYERGHLSRRTTSQPCPAPLIAASFSIGRTINQFQRVGAPNTGRFYCRRISTNQGYRFDETVTHRQEPGNWPWNLRKRQTTMTEDFHMLRLDIAGGVRGDWLLQMFVALADEKNLELSVIIAAEGVLMAGTLIGADGYFKELADSFDDARSSIPEITQAMSRALLNVKEIYAESGSNSSQQRTQFLHLRGARRFSPSISGSGSLWRCRLDRITGFSFGTIKLQLTAAEEVLFFGWIECSCRLCNTAFQF